MWSPRPASRCYIQRVVQAVVVVDVLCLLTESGAMTELLCRFFWDLKLKRLQINGHRKEARSRRSSPCLVWTLTLLRLLRLDVLFERHMACATGPAKPLVIGQLIAHNDARLVAAGVRRSWGLPKAQGLSTACLADSCRSWDAPSLKILPACWLYSTMVNNATQCSGCHHILSSSEASQPSGEVWI